MKTKKIISILLLVTALFLLVVLVAEIMLSAPHLAYVSSKSVWQPNITYELEGNSGETTLPASFKNLKPRTKLVLAATIAPEAGESLYVKSVYAPLKVYLDGVLLYECGQDGSYPNFMQDPPTTIALLPLPTTKSPMDLRLEYLSPFERSTLSVPEVVLGQRSALIAKLLRRNGFSLIFSVILLFTGFCLLLPAALFLRLKSGSPLFQLGLFAIAVGIWGGAECDLTAFLIPYPALLYIFSFLGLFTMAIPLIKFGLLMLTPHKLCYNMLNTTRSVLCICVVGALILEFAGIMGLHRSMYLFHLIIPAAIAMLGFCILWEYFRHSNPVAGRFIIPGIILSISAVLEVMNYQLRFTHVLSLFFQLGMVLFVISLGLIAGLYSRQAMLTAVEKTRLELEVASIAYLLEMQKEQYSMLMQNAEAIKKQRHDLRHQFTVLKSYVSKNETDKFDAYIHELIAKIPIDRETVLCENYAVNAVALHYLSIARTADIDVSIKLIVPAKNGCVQDSDLCIIVGNLFENAIEACTRMTVGARYIALNSRIQYDTLTITVDNSFDGVTEQRGESFYSQKRQGVGTGLSSVLAMAEKYGGSAKFEPIDKIFQSSVYIQLIP